MSVVFNASGDYLRRTSNLPSLTSFTICGWVRKRSVIEGRYTYWLGIENGTTNATRYNCLGQRSSNAWEMEGDAEQVLFTRTPNAEQWVFMALTIAGTGVGQQKAYLARDTDSTLEIVTNSNTLTSYTPAMIGMGNNSYSEYLDGDLAQVRVWNVVLTQTEIEAEWASARAVKSSGLLWEYRLADNTDTADLSGNGYDPTIGGTLGSSDHPPTGSGLTTPQKARPASDLSVGNWTNEASSTSNIYQSVDETTASDADYAESGDDPSGDVIEWGLSSVTDPNSSSGHIVRFRYRHVGDGTLNATFYLVQGTTVIASKTINSIGASWTSDSFTLTSGEADSITNYADLRIRVSASKV